MPGKMLTLPITGLSGIAEQITSDSAGNLYIAENNAPNPSKVVKETLTANGYVESAVAQNLQQPITVAVDGAGNVYFADVSSFQPYVATLTPNGYTVSQLGAPASGFRIAAIAVDGSGNIYLADELTGISKETPLIGGGYAQTVIAASYWTFAIAVDGTGNLYLCSLFSTNGGAATLGLQKATFANGTYTISAIGSSSIQPQGVAVDGIGNVYTYDQHTANLVKETLSGGSYVESTLPFVPVAGRGVSVDGKGNVYAVPQQDGVIELDISDPPALNFATTAIGQTSNDSPRTVTIENIGNTTAYTPPPSAGTNPSISAGFVLNTGTSSACPTVSAGSSTGTLVVGASCEFSVSFSPVSAGTDNGAIVLTYAGANDPPGNYRTETIALSGTAPQAVPTNLLTSSANPAFVSNPVTFTATLSSGVAVPSGTVSFYDGSTLLGPSTVTSGVATFVTTALAAGQHSITASYSGDVNFTAATSTAVAETIEDFSFAPANGGTYSAAASRGGAAVFTLPFAPVNGTTFPAKITLSVTGLPSGATAAFSPTTIPAGSGTTNVTLTVALPKQGSAQSWRGSFFRGRIALGLAVILLPFASIGRKIVCPSKSMCALILGLSSVILSTSLTGCGGSSTSPITPSQPQTYTLTITASSGPLSHSVTATLRVE
jgi:hypothetical protein